MSINYKLINLEDIDTEARRIAVAWVENFKPIGGSDIQAKHKLASDIMNYAESRKGFEAKAYEELLEENRKLKTQIDQANQYITSLDRHIKQG